MSRLKLELRNLRDMVKVITKKWDIHAINIYELAAANAEKWKRQTEDNMKEQDIFCIQCELAAARGDKLKSRVKNKHERIESGKRPPDSF